jgi:hypothetical protein
VKLLIAFVPTIIALAQLLLGWAYNKQMIPTDTDQEIARQTLAMLKMTQTGQQLLRKIDNTGDADVKGLLKQLGERVE